MLLENLKCELQNLVADAEHDRAFQRLREIVSPKDNNRLYSDIIAVQSRYSEAKRAGNLNLIDFKEINQNFSHVAQAQLWLTERISLDDLSDLYRTESASHRAIPTIHSLTCDRSRQKSAFDEHHLFEPGPAEKFQFFYLYGDVRQGHESLFKRFAHDLKGLINSRWRQGAAIPAREPVFRVCKPEFSESPRLFEMYVLRDLFACFFEPLNDRQINTGSRLIELLESPDIKTMGPDGQVFVLFMIDDFNWRKEVTPLVVKRLFEGFYQCQLPPEAPRFFFFFGLKYSKTNTAVKDEVRDAIDAAVHGKPLVELEPLTIIEIGEWLSRYPELCGRREALEMATYLFGDQNKSFDMADVEPKLLETIEKYNKRLLI